MYVCIYDCLDMCVYYLRGEIGIESCAPLKAAVIYEQEEEIEKNVERQKKKEKKPDTAFYFFGMQLS